MTSLLRSHRFYKNRNVLTNAINEQLQPDGIWISRCKNIPHSPKWCMEFSTVDTHKVLYDWLSSERLNIHEILLQTSPRVLYFDLEGKTELFNCHTAIIEQLIDVVGYVLNITNPLPKPEVLNASRSSRYSAHVLFPEIQFKDHTHQTAFISLILNSIYFINPKNYSRRCLSEYNHYIDTSNGQGEGRTGPLYHVIDKATYSTFQNFRAPLSFKHAHLENLNNIINLNNILDLDTQLRREKGWNDFNNDNLSFVGFTDPSIVREIPVSQEKVQERYYELTGGGSLISYSPKFRKNRNNSLKPDWFRNSLSLEEFKQYNKEGTLNFSEMDDSEIFKEILKNISPYRAEHFESWFKICFATSCLMKEYNYINSDVVDTIKETFLDWSCSSKHYGAQYRKENTKFLSDALATDWSVPAQGMLLKILKFDNPDMQIMWNLVEQNRFVIQNPSNLNFCGLDDLQSFYLCLSSLHPDRANNALSQSYVKRAANYLCTIYPNNKDDILREVDTWACRQLSKDEDYFETYRDGLDELMKLVCHDNKQIIVIGSSLLYQPQFSKVKQNTTIEESFFSKLSPLRSNHMRSLYKIASLVNNIQSDTIQGQRLLDNLNIKMSPADVQMEFMEWKQMELKHDPDWNLEFTNFNFIKAEYFINRLFHWDMCMFPSDQLNTIKKIKNNFIFPSEEYQRNSIKMMINNNAINDK
eukprot:GHVL01040659.1.p1 GENE.GHVL01040659.1~~GHVL01040659.1.p1  ORF type:complete len:698 (-),score=97.88 GHVL01040659.1:257-2350(-)